MVLGSNPRWPNLLAKTKHFADLAHPVEQRPRNAQVIGSSPIVGFISLLFHFSVFWLHVKIKS